MRIGVKAWAKNVPLIPSLRELYARGVFDYVELFIHPGADQFIGSWKGLPFPFFFHAPHSYAGFNPAVSEKMAENRGLLGSVDLFFRELSPEIIVFHSGIDGTVAEAIRQFQVYSRDFPGVFTRAVLENKPAVGLRGERCMGATAAEMKELLAGTGFGLCLDFGHAVCTASAYHGDWRQMVEEFVALGPRMFHLSDGHYGVKDEHLHLGEGQFDLRSLAGFIPDGAAVTLETPKGSEVSLDDFERDVSYFKDIFIQGDSFRLRPAIFSDEMNFFEWRNDPVVIVMSVTQSKVLPEEHQRWFRAKLASPDAFLYVIEDKAGAALGQVRIDVTEGRGHVSIALAASARGAGIGRAVLKMISSVDAVKRSIRKLEAKALRTNAPSLRAFHAAGFKEKAVVFEGGLEFVLLEKDLL